jgi:hypothetical protein
VHSVTNRVVIDEMATHSSFSIISRDQYAVSMTATAENPVKPLLLCPLNLGGRFYKHPKLRKFICIKHFFQGTIT